MVDSCNGGKIQDTQDYKGRSPQGEQKNAVFFPNWKSCIGTLPGKSGRMGRQRWKKSMVANSVFASSISGSRRNEAQGSKAVDRTQEGLAPHPQRFRIIPC